MILTSGAGVITLGQPRAWAAPASHWEAATQSRARLIAAGGLGVEAPRQTYLAGLEITLDPGVHTYWRAPGDSGVPPVFDFAKSQNIQTTEVQFPVPEKMQESGLAIFGYRDAVVFPIRVTPHDATKPVQLVLQLDYATCDKICVPAHAVLSLTLTPQDAPQPDRATLATWQARVPREIDASTLHTGPAHLADNGHWVWQVALATPQQTLAVFPEVETPGWFVVARKETQNGFELEAVDQPPAVSGPLPVRVTLATPQGGITTRLRLDGPATKP